VAPCPDVLRNLWPARTQPAGTPPPWPPATDAPPWLQQQLYQAFDIQALYNKNLHQVTIHATITDSTPRTVAAITADAGSGPAASTQADATPGPVFRIGCSSCGGSD
jgi:hypothetical protein